MKKNRLRGEKSLNLQRQIALIMICWALALFYIRWIISGIIAYQLNNSALKKRQKGITFKERLLYSRYCEEVHKVFLYLYFLIMIGHPLVLFVCLILRVLGPYDGIGGILAKGVAGFDLGWLLLYILAFWVGRGSGPHYSRWIKKKRGMPPKRKK